MKKRIALLLAGLMAVGSVLTGCGSKETEKKVESEVQTSAKSETKAETGNEKSDPDHIIVTYLYQTSTPADLGKVQDAVNEITIPAVNVEVEFKPLGFGDSFTNYSLWISSGEVVDLMMIAFQDIKTYANSGQIEVLDSYISEDKTPTLYKLMQEFPIASTVAGEIYGLTPVGVNYGEQSGLIIRQEWLDETDYEKKDIYSMEDLTDIFSQIKANHPDSYPLGVRGADIMTGASLYSSVKGCENPGSTVNAGTLMDKNSTTLVNLFKTDEYKDFLEQMASWYQAGYIVPDAATTDTTNNEMLMSGKTASYCMSQKPEQFMVDYGFDITGLPTGEARIGATSVATNWTVPVTSKNPEAAIRFMDYLYSDSKLSNLITAGIEGVHYKIVDAENNVVDFADGLDGTNSPYYNLLGFWGDRRNEVSFSAGVTRKEHEAFTEKCMANKYQSYGFVFDSASVTNQIMACQSVLDQYQKALETGSLGSDWKSTYDTMVSQLDTAGIDQVIEECQKQLDAYLAAK